MNKQRDELMQYALEHGSACIGFKDGKAIYVSAALLGQVGLQKCKEMFGLIRRWPVRTDLSGNVVMVEGSTHQDAIERYLNRLDK